MDGIPINLPFTHQVYRFLLLLESPIPSILGGEKPQGNWVDLPIYFLLIKILCRSGPNQGSNHFVMLTTNMTCRSHNLWLSMHHVMIANKLSFLVLNSPTLHPTQVFMGGNLDLRVYNCPFIEWTVNHHDLRFTHSS